MEQALFGYRHGHEMIVSSSRLWAEINSIVLPFTDRPTAASRSKLDSWLTAFPLTDRGLYYIGKSWAAAAAEHLRPGAVWTHGLIVEAAALETIGDLRLLLPVFRRPTLSIEVARFQESLAIAPLERWSESDTREMPLGLYAATLLALYRAPESEPVFVEWPEKNGDPDLAVLTLWNGQWPASRQDLSFATYAVNAPSPRGRPFDLVFARTEELRRLEPQHVVAAGDSEQPQELAFLARCMFQSSEPLEEYRLAFRDHLDLPARPRQSAAGAALALEKAFQGAALDTVGQLASVLPRLHEAPGFKQAVLGPGGLLAKSAGEAATIEAIAIAGDDALDAGALELVPRTAGLWTEPEQALGLARRLAEAKQSPLAAGVATALLEGMPRETISWATDSESFADLLEWLGPSNSAPFLRANPEVVRALTRQLRRRPKLSSFRDELANIGIRSPATDLPEEAGSGKSLGRNALLHAMERAIESGTPVGEGWVSRLLSDQRQLTDWLKETPLSPTVALPAIVRYLDPGAPEVKRLGWKFWLPCVHPAKAQGEFSEVHHFLLAIAFSLGWFSNGSLSEAVYDAVYRGQSGVEH